MKTLQAKTLSEKNLSPFPWDMENDSAVQCYGYEARTNYPLTRIGENDQQQDHGTNVLQMKEKSVSIPGSQHQQGCNCENCTRPASNRQLTQLKTGTDIPGNGSNNNINTVRFPVVQRAKTDKNTKTKTKKSPVKTKKNAGGNKKPGIKKPEHRKASKAALSRGIKAEQIKKDWDFATGHKSSGKWTEDVTVRTAHSFDAERVRQVLRHLATLVFHFVKSKITDEQEVQAMYVDDRLMLSSNDPSSMALFANLDSRAVFDIFLSKNYLSESDERALGDVNKLRALIGGSRIEDLEPDPAAAAILTQVADTIKQVIIDPKNYLPVIELSDAPAAISSDAYKDKIIIVKGIDGAHAEQNLILAYAKSGSKQTGHIYGKKRPCTGCYMTFVYATQKLGCNLVYNQNAGGFWGPAEVGLWQLMQQTPALTIGDVDAFVHAHLPDMTHRTARTGRKKAKDKRKSRHDGKNEDTAYDSGSDSEAEDYEMSYSSFKKRFIDQ